MENFQLRKQAHILFKKKSCVSNFYLTLLLLLTPSLLVFLGGSSSPFKNLNGAYGQCAIFLASGVNSDNQSVCKNSALQTIKYHFVGGSGGTVDGLPTGVTYSVTAVDTLEIYGTPSIEGIYNYTVNVTGNNCAGSNVLFGKITSGGGFLNNNFLQKVCPGVSIAPIPYYIIGTNSSVYGLPASINVSAPVAVSGGSTLTMSGTSTLEGTYNFTITSTGSPCLSQSSFKGVLIIQKMDVNILTSNTSATASCDGYLEAVAKGTSPYSYSWSNASTTAILNSGICAGNYSVTVTDSTGCISTASATVGSKDANSSSPLTIKVYSNGVSNQNLCDGKAYVKLSGGVPPYTISFAGNTVSKTKDTISNLCSGFYTINASDSQSNTSAFTFVITEPGTIFNNIDSTTLQNTVFVDTLVISAVNNCIINLDKIDSIKIASYSFSNSNTLIVVWNFYNKKTYVSFQSEYTYTTPGKYTLIIDMYCTNRSSGSVRGEDDLTVDPRILGVETFSTDDVGSVYPNPFNNSIKIDVKSFSTVKITDISGQTIYIGNANTGVSSIETGNYDSGIYFITITNTQGIVVTKLIKG